MRRLTLAASRGTIAYCAEGTGPAVVFLHAFPLDADMWRDQIHGLSAVARVVAMDVPGFGASDRDDALSIDAVADAVRALCDHLGVGRAIVGGVSMGGYAAMAFARRHPDRLAGLILANTKAEPDDDAGRATRDKTIAVIERQGTGPVVDQLVPKLLGPRTLVEKPDVVARVREMALRQRAEGVVAALRALRDRPDARAGLASIRVPTLIVAGADDGVTPPDRAEAMHAAIPGSELHVIPEVGHLSNLEAPAAFDERVAAFLRAHPFQA